MFKILLSSVLGFVVLILERKSSSWEPPYPNDPGENSNSLTGQIQYLCECRWGFLDDQPVKTKTKIFLSYRRECPVPTWVSGLSSLWQIEVLSTKAVLAITAINSENWKLWWWCGWVEVEPITKSIYLYNFGSLTFLIHWSQTRRIGAWKILVWMAVRFPNDCGPSFTSLRWVHFNHM